jgi:hypothetical protein
LRPGANRLAVAALLGLALAAVQVFARAAPGQEQTSAPATQPTAAPIDQPKPAPMPNGGKSEAPAAVVEEPPVKYVRDKNGQLVPLLGFTWEELQEFHRQREAAKNGAAQPRNFDLQQLVIAGEATDSRVELTATYKIRLDEDNKWLEIPLVTGGAVLTEPAIYQGSGEHVVRFDTATGAYTATLRGPARSVHELTLKFFVQLKNVGAQRRLELDLPAAAASRMSIKVPHESAAVTASTGAVTAEVNRLGKGKSEIHAWGLGGPLSLAWKEGAGTVAAATSRLVAEGQILVELDSHSARFDATLAIRSLAEEFDRFQVKLPADANRLIGENANNGYTLSGGVDGDGVVTVQLPQKTKGPVKVRVLAERAYDVTNPEETLELAGFEVVEALPHRQWGHIAVDIKDDWQLALSKTDRVQQVEELPNGLKRDGALGFEYFGRPASLAVRVSPRKTRITVEPEYIYKIEADRIRLEAKLKYVVRGGKAFDFSVEMPGWSVDEIGPPGVIDTEQFWSGEGPLHTIPLIQGANGKFELTISAIRPRTDDSNQIEFTLPTPHAERVEPALVVVQAEDNVRLRPNEEELVSMSRIASAGALRLPIREQAPLIYRAERPGAKFVGTAERLPRTISIVMDGNIDVRPDGVLVEQLLQYKVEHEPLDALNLIVPKQLADEGRWELLIDNMSVAALSEPMPTADADKMSVRASLLEPRSGTFTAVVKHKQPLGLTDSPSGEPVRIPLVMPDSDSIKSNHLTVTRESTLRAAPYDEDWTIAEEPTAPGERSNVPALRLSATTALPELRLSVNREVRQSTGSSIVERGWVQTWVGAGVRQDRAAYHLVSSEEQISFTLPKGAVEHLQIKINGEAFAAEPDAKGRYSVSLPPQKASHQLVVTYQLPGAGVDSHSLEFELPKFDGNVGVHHLYWHLAMPASRHLIDAPARITPEFTWQWSGFGWERRSSMEHRELESWTGVSLGAPLPESTNRYLFSLSGNPDKIEVLTAKRGELVFVTSLAVLVLGLVLIQFQILRRPVTLFAIGVLIAALAAWKAESALLFVQAALLGLALVLLAALIEFTQTHRRGSPQIVRSGGSSILDSRPAPASVRAAASLAPASTESLPVEIEMPAAESSSR